MYTSPFLLYWIDTSCCFLFLDINTYVWVLLTCLCDSGLISLNARKRLLLTVCAANLYTQDRKRACM